MRRYFCTYFDDNYMLYGLTMFRSLCNVCPDLRLFVLCLNDATYDKLQSLDERIVPIPLSELEAYDPELLATKSTRSIVEYYFTISPCLPLFLFHKYPELDILTYLDGDLYFFSSPECLYEELGNKSILLCRHNFSDSLREQAELFGRYNVAFQIYRNNEICHNCLRWWRERCLEWCYDRAENGKFADQKYLDGMVDWFQDTIKESDNIGADVAPWNMRQYVIQKNTVPLINGFPLIFMHYQGFRLLGKDFVRWPMLYGNITVHVWSFFARKYYKSLMKTQDVFEKCFKYTIKEERTLRMSIQIKDNYARICNIIPFREMRKMAKLFYMSLSARKEGIAFHGIRFF